MGSALDELEVPTPRPEALCIRYARRMDPWWGFLIAGALITLFSIIILAVVMMKVMVWLDIRDGSAGAKVGSAFIVVFGVLVAQVIYARWRGRRLSLKRGLVRDGRIFAAQVRARRRNLVGAGTRQYSTVVRLVGPGLDADCGFNLWFAPAEGTTIKVLYDPDVRPILAFDAAGRMYSGLVL